MVMIDEQMKKMINDFLIKELSPSVIYLFGSQATGTIHKESDYDLAYLSNKTVSNYERFMIAQQLAAMVNRDVDLVNLNEASTVFQTQIISKGVVLYCNDENQRLAFEMVTLKKYAILNEERQCILKDIVERGQVYEE
jgi:predicted nucleotidyltransferase